MSNVLSVPLVRAGAFYEYPTFLTTAWPQNDSDMEAESQTAVHVNLIESFLDHIQNLNIAS